MDYQQARDYIIESDRFPDEFTLADISCLLDYLDHPEKKLEFVHVAGTNGKGSVLAYVSAALVKAGYRIGRYISPTLYSYEERFQINGKPIDKRQYVSCMERIAQAVSKMESDGHMRPTPFELETALSFLYFSDQKCDLVLLECGMGGELDATNVIDHKKVAVFASISLDHMEYLGDSLDKIAKVKAGIIQPGCAVVTTCQAPEALMEIEKKAKLEGCPVTVTDYHSAKEISFSPQEQSFSYEGKVYTIHLGGICQIQNAVLAIKVLQVLNQAGFNISEENIHSGLALARWPGRFTILRKKPVFVVDGAHNPDAADKFVKSLLKGFTGRKIIYIMGVFQDKDYKEIVRITVPCAQEVIAIATPENPRALPAKELAKEVGQYTEHVHAAESLQEAVAMAMEMAKGEDVIAAFGSLSFLGELTQIVEKLPEDNND